MIDGLLDIMNIPLVKYININIANFKCFKQIKIKANKKETKKNKEIEFKKREQT
jgi:hypothetical protein